MEHHFRQRVINHAVKRMGEGSKIWKQRYYALMYGASFVRLASIDKEKMVNFGTIDVFKKGDVISTPHIPTRWERIKAWFGIKPRENDYYTITSAFGSFESKKSDQYGVKWR